MVMQYFQYPLAAFALADEMDRNRYGSRKSSTVRSETAKGAVADLYYLLDQSGGEVSYSQRFWGRRWEWNPAEVDKLLKKLLAAGLLTLRKTSRGSRCLTRPKKHISAIVSKSAEKNKLEVPAQQGQTGNIITFLPLENKQQISTVFSNNPIKEKNILFPEAITATSGRRKKQLTGQLAAWFMALYEAYGDKRGRAEAAWAFLEIPDLDAELLSSRIIPAAKEYAANRPALVAKGLTPKMLQFWITAMRWEDFDPHANAHPGKTAADITREKYLRDQA